MSPDFSRVIMPLPEKSTEFIDDALTMIHKRGWIHLYAHLNSSDDDILMNCNNIISKELDERSRIVSSRIVKHIGPGWYQIVFDIEVIK